MTREEADDLLQQWWYEVRGSLKSRQLRKRIVDAMTTTSKPAGELGPGTLEELRQQIIVAQKEIELLRKARQLSPSSQTEGYGCEAPIPSALRGGTEAKPEGKEPYPLPLQTPAASPLTCETPVKCPRCQWTMTLDEAAKPSHAGARVFTCTNCPTSLETDRASPPPAPGACETCGGTKQVACQECRAEEEGARCEFPGPCPDCESPTTCPESCGGKEPLDNQMWWILGRSYCSEACFIARRPLHPANPQANPQRAR